MPAVFRRTGTLMKCGCRAARAAPLTVSRPLQRRDSRQSRPLSIRRWGLRPMSQSNLERTIGLLVTDEGFRRRFRADPQGALQDLAVQGIAFTGCEQRALASMDFHALARFAEAIDPRLAKIDLEGGAP